MERRAAERLGSTDVSSSGSNTGFEDEQPLSEGVCDSDYRFLFETVMDGVLLATNEGTILDANPAACHILEKRREDIVAAKLHWVFDSSDFRYVPALGEQQRTGRFEGELRMLRRHGELFTAMVAIASSQDKDGREMLSIVFQDVTERKRLEEVLQETEERFRLLVDGAKDCAIFTLDSEGRVTSWSASAENTVGYHAEEIIGQHFSHFYTQEDIERGLPKEELRTAVNEARYEIEGWRVRKDGSRFWAGVIITALRNETFSGFAVMVRDITERKQTQEELRESEERFKVTFDLATIGIAHFGTDGRWLRVNRKFCDILGYTREELLEKTFQDITHPDDLDTELYQVRRMLSGEIGAYSLEKRYVKKNRSLVWVSVTVSFMRGPSDESSYFISIVEDITERKHKELLLHSLTPREVEVLQLLAQGYTNREIAKIMNFSTGTAKTNVGHIIRKLGVFDRTQAAVRAVEIGLISSNNDKGSYFQSQDIHRHP